MSSIHETLSDYKKIDRLIEVLWWVLFTLFAVLSAKTIWLIFERNDEALWASLPSLGTMISALIIAKAATRLLLHTQIYKEDARRKEVVRTTHHAMVVVNNVTDLVGFARHCLLKGNAPLIALITTAKEIGEKAKLFYDPDLNSILTPKAYELIRTASGSIHGLSMLGLGLEATLSQKELQLPVGMNPNNETLQSNLSEVKIHLDELFAEIEKIRGQVT